MNMLGKTDVDLIAGGCIVETGGESKIKLNNIPDGFYNLHDDGDYFYSKMLHYEGFFKFGIQPYLWNKIFKRKMLLQAYQDMDLLINDGEDVAIIQSYFAIASRVIVFSEAKYHYSIHPFQKTASKGDDFYENASRLYLWLKKRLKQQPFFDLFLPQLDQYMRYLIWMKEPEAFPSGGRLFQFPFQKIPADSSIVLHGAGNVGKSYYAQLSDTGYCRRVYWVDSNYISKKAQGMKSVESPDTIFDIKFDYILIAIANVEIAEQICQFYLEKGVQREKIIF
jgi:hypothetical protein